MIERVYALRMSVYIRVPAWVVPSTDKLMMQEPAPFPPRSLNTSPHDWREGIALYGLVVSIRDWFGCNTLPLAPVKAPEEIRELTGVCDYKGVERVAEWAREGAIPVFGHRNAERRLDACIQEFAVLSERARTMQRTGTGRARSLFGLGFGFSAIRDDDKDISRCNAFFREESILAEEGVIASFGSTHPSLPLFCGILERQGGDQAEDKVDAGAPVA